ncbi:hypothetical protein BJX99DRAFT_258041 [Aspergillus californicus]
MATRSPLLSTFNHVVLPPNIPGAAETQNEDLENDLICRLLDSVKILKQKAEDDSLPTWQLVENTLKISSLANQGEMCNKSALVKVLRRISPDHALMVRIREQNAGLLIRKPCDNEESVIFESFEISPSAEHTLAGKGALQWDFPGAAVSMPYDVFDNHGFRDTLASFLEKASTQLLPEFAAKARKAGAEIVEERDTADPAIITEFLMTLIETNGKRLCIPILRKRVKDDVCWDNAKLPWRRSPFWLSLRVCVQRLLYIQLGSDAGRIQYKALLCMFLAKLLSDCVMGLNSERYELLKVKLCRRLAKLDAEKEELSDTRRAINVSMHVIGVIEPYCTRSIDNATTAIRNEWESWKRGFLRQVPKLPSRASADDLRLTLPNSIEYFRNILKPRQVFAPRAKVIEPKLLAEIAEKNTTKQFATLTKSYSLLEAFETRIELSAFDIPCTTEAIEKECIHLASSITDYIDAVGNAYDDNPEQISLFILTVFDLWMAMDKHATAMYPLLNDYHPWFTPEILDVLLLSRWKNMRRLETIQCHIQSRCTKAKRGKMTIFEDPSPGCFAEQYFGCPEIGTLQKLRVRILDASRRAEEKKMQELDGINKIFDDLTEQIAVTSCTQLRNLDGSHDIRGCKHCYYLRRQRRLEIKIHEDFLPMEKENLIQQKSIVFELNPPKAFAAFREATWKIVNRLGAKINSSEKRKPEMLLSEYWQLEQYNDRPKDLQFSLASSTKSFLRTHYGWSRWPAKSYDILLPHGLKYSYYDWKRQLWHSDYPEQLSLAHHFTLSIPNESPFLDLYRSPVFAVDKEGPSSFEVIASVTECPSQLTVHEFKAHQSLMGGRNRRWLSILAELGSSNLNWSLPETMVLSHHLILQAGPRLENDSRRAVHVLFRDMAFCNRLTEEVSRHVEALASNWRETNYMETLLTLSIRMFSLGAASSRHDSTHLILRIRQITLNWITLLRNETRNAEDVFQSDRAARYCFVSALLCRRTFTPWLTSQAGFDAESLKCFFEASLAMQESLVVDLSKFTTITRNMIVRDVKMVSRMAPLLRAGAIRYQNSIGLAIDASLGDFEGKHNVYTEWELLESPYDNWATSTTDGSEGNLPQIFYFHLLDGHLVIDGQTLGKLPADIRDSEILKELFGNQRLFARPSNLPGMDYALANQAEGHQVHLGYRDNELIIQARTSRAILELVHWSVFGADSSFDIPFPMIADCIHWVDLRTGVLEIRQKPRIWTRRDGNWTLDIRNRTAHRRGSTLIDPFSNLARRISNIFLHFEHACRIEIFQTPSTLCVEFRRMVLDFLVTNTGELKCRQLGAVVDRNQDAGTFYGLQTMLVLRDVHDWSQRSIITPIGTAVCTRDRSHVLVDIIKTGLYVKYGINNVLGRLDCPAEPRLLYAKAHFHALTSHLLPDPLTGRSGTQEALNCLESGYCKPWLSLQDGNLQYLVDIASLTPRREYYPKNKRSQQTVIWRPELTANIQHEGFQGAVDAIISHAERLEQFTTVTVKSTPKTQATTPLHLRERAIWRRSIYESPDTLPLPITRPEDRPYASRDGWCTSKRRSNVCEVVTLLRQQPGLIHTTRRLSGLLSGWTSVGGYETTYSLFDLEDCLNADFAEQWGGLINMCRNAKKDEVYNLMFQLGLTVFRNGIEMTPIRVIISFFLLEELRALEVPRFSSFVGFVEDEEPTLQVLRPIIRIAYRPIKGPKKSDRVANDENRKFGYDVDCEREGVELAEELIRQWPCQKPSTEVFEGIHLDVVAAMEALLPEWQRMYQNMHLQRHIARVQTILNAHYSPKNDVARSCEPSNRKHKETMGPRRRHVFSSPRLGEDLLQKPALSFDNLATFSLNTSKIDKPSDLSSPGLDTPQRFPPEIAELAKITRALSKSDCSVRSIYAQDLEHSISSLKAVKKSPETSKGLSPSWGIGRAKLNEELKTVRAEVDAYYTMIRESLSANDTRYAWLRKCGLWPHLTPITILQQLRSISSHQFSPGMKSLFISYASTISKLQKLFRLKEAYGKSNESNWKQELSDPGHTNWRVEDFPDWLLLEIETNIQIRQDQVTVALEMISPSSGLNSVLQMNMGLGKTSVIMPMVAAVLANGEMLNRLLVPKALLSQAAQVLQSRLGGLLGRTVIHVPFSRRTRTTVTLIKEYRELHEDMLLTAGIVLGVPEHILSFKLSGLQRLADSKLTEAVGMVETQAWMDEVCRDVLDECDFTLAVKTQLIYPGGAQLAVDGHPERWEVSMAILGLVAHHLKDLEREFPQSIDILERNSTGFPVTHFLRQDVERALVSKIVDDICAKRTAILPLRDCNQKDKDAIRLFISQEDVKQSVTKRISKLFPDTPRAKKNVYLLRGLLVYGILILCLKKRWNVQYGLHRGRDPMAVPFHAKGVPSEQAEWGHPDVAILFTCLAFYYEGLSQCQLKRSLEAVLKSDTPAAEYDRWTQSSTTLPEALRHWNTITVDDVGLVGEIWRHLRFKTVVVNHFLSKFVFPPHAKQFATKLQASGWDVLLYNTAQSLAAEDVWMRPGISTGFSGTNDNRRLLPLHIEQCDLPGLSHTNAEVLTYLLQPRNRRYRVATHSNGRRLSEVNLLEYLHNQEIRVLIDAGAFIMEMDNITVAKAWIQTDWKAKGVVYFGDDNQPWVMHRNLKRVPFLASPFADDLDGCLVYLDEAHTRGTDLKLPASAVGALTLGLSQTKDQTVQAAMRLRQLGTTQSVTIIAPPEVHQRILDVCKKTSRDTLDSSDVITWLLDQTCATNRELQPLYFAQGKNFCQRMQAASGCKKFLSNVEHRKKYLEILQQPEQQMLQQLYEPCYGNAADSLLAPTESTTGGKVAKLINALAERRQEAQMYESVLSSALEEVEQEREVAYEVEEEREIQRPRRPKALKFAGLHKSIWDFAKGHFLGSENIITAAKMLEATELGEKYGIQGSSLVPHIYLSAEFIRTIKLKKTAEKNDTYTRPVNWILFNMVTQTALIIIPEEAEALIPMMRTTNPPNTHLIMYAAPWTRSMLRFDTLTFYALPSLPDKWVAPSWLPFELGILGGRLYFAFSDYATILGRLSLPSGAIDEELEEVVDQEGSKNRLAFLREWLAIRRQGQDITDTPMGYVLQGWPLRSDHPFFLSMSIKPDGESGLESLRFGSPDKKEEYYTSGDEMSMDEDTYGDMDGDVAMMDVGGYDVSEVEDVQ